MVRDEGRSPEGSSPESDPALDEGGLGQLFADKIQ